MSAKVGQCLPPLRGLSQPHYYYHNHHHLLLLQLSQLPPSVTSSSQLPPSVTSSSQLPPSVTIIITTTTSCHYHHHTTTICHYHHNNHHHLSLSSSQQPPFVSIIITTTTTCHYHHHNHHHLSLSSSQPPNWLAMNTAENNNKLRWIYCVKMTKLIKWSLYSFKCLHTHAQVSGAENEITYSWSKEEERDHFAALTDVDASRAHGQASSASGPNGEERIIVENLFSSSQDNMIAPKPSFYAR